MHLKLGAIKLYFMTVHEQKHTKANLARSKHEAILKKNAIISVYKIVKALIIKKNRPYLNLQEARYFICPGISANDLK